jgi:hypothetical protein
MLTCPLCQKELAEAAPRCPRCQADVSLLADFVTDLKTLLDKADAHRRAGDIAAAVQAYLAVLDVDPGNAAARAALGPGLLAVRAVESLGRPRRRLTGDLLVAALIVTAFVAGFLLCLWLFHDLISHQPIRGVSLVPSGVSTCDSQCCLGPGS